MELPLLDLSFLYELSDNDTVYIQEVIQLFLNTVPKGLKDLENAVRNTDDFDAIKKKAHFLKSSANIVKVRGMYDDLVEIEALARAEMGKDEITARLNNILVNFNEALPLIRAEKEKCEKINKGQSA